ncbi:hypothetical protein AJ79_04128 [Helicocarpus griseus UAMH5409]|uniref:Uncharacterized protein n=1 Tax=Helicocarpus griseus UAMH5409 TaxID=1447875 RepID=A0A2B7XUF3_9EURO|nr:hypothetical protein AJ79_04128 [Helicocarpus griseus UAMH5409]
MEMILGRAGEPDNLVHDPLAMELAVTEDAEDAVYALELLLEKGAEITDELATIALDSGQRAILKMILHRNANPNVRNGFGRAALSLALEETIPDPTQFLSLVGGNDSMELSDNDFPLPEGGAGFIIEDDSDDYYVY